MKTVYLLRHAKSSWTDQEAADFDRRLAPRGRDAARAMAAHMKAAGMDPALVLCSAARRTTETWSLMARTLGPTAKVKRLRTLYLAAPGRILTLVRRLPDGAGDALIIGHNPGMHDVALRLAGQGEDKAMRRLQAKFPTGALAVLRFDAARWRDIAEQAGTLAAFVRPKDLA